MEQPFDGVDEIYNQKLGEVLNFFASKLSLYFSSARLTLLLTLLDNPPDRLRPITGVWADIIPLPSRMKMMDSHALHFLSSSHLSIYCYIFRDFLDSGHPLALDAKRHSTAALACLKIIFKPYQVPLSCFHRFWRHSLAPRLCMDSEHLSHWREENLPGWIDFLGIYFSTNTGWGIPEMYANLEHHQRTRSNHLQFLLEKSAYSDSLLNFARRRVFRFGYLHKKHPTYMKKAFFALANYIHRVTGETAEVRACESIWGHKGWFSAD